MTAIAEDLLNFRERLHSELPIDGTTQLKWNI
jgi:hypothetical protein